ncbi:MAG TPA: hypothetical protein VJ022_06585, partial [Anaerolineales bacterium]|nr:hypothetical protein [Anaerolineales bacterium]
MATTAAEKTKIISINDQLVAVTKQSTKLRNSLDAKHTPEAIEGLKYLENSLERLSEIIIPFELKYSHLQALAGIGQVVNSTLEVDEVLQIVMD